MRPLLVAGLVSGSGARLPGESSVPAVDHGRVSLSIVRVPGIDFHPKICIGMQ